MGVTALRTRRTIPPAIRGGGGAGWDSDQPPPSNRRRSGAVAPSGGPQAVYQGIPRQHVRGWDCISMIKIFGGNSIVWKSTTVSLKMCEKCELIWHRKSTERKHTEEKNMRDENKWKNVLKCQNLLFFGNHTKVSK